MLGIAVWHGTLRGEPLGSFLLRKINVFEQKSVGRYLAQDKGDLLRNVLSLERIILFISRTR